MANLMCPLEKLSERVHTILRDYTRESLEDDGVIDGEEHQRINDIRSVRDNLIDFAARRKLARHIEQMEDVTDYTVRLAKAADLGLIDLTAERRKRTSNVIEFHPRNRNHAG